LNTTGWLLPKKEEKEKKTIFVYWFTDLHDKM
jgi:hypothetical protein